LLLFAAQFIARGDRDRESRVVPDSASTMPAATDCGSPAVAEAMAQQTNHISLRVGLTAAWGADAVSGVTAALDAAFHLVSVKLSALQLM
jgi:hypothetical protein